MHAKESSSAARHSTGRVCADKEPMHLREGDSCHLGSDKSLEANPDWHLGARAEPVQHTPKLDCFVRGSRNKKVKRRDDEKRFDEVPVSVRRRHELVSLQRDWLVE